MTLDLEAVKATRVIVAHQMSPARACADGLGAAMILHDVLPNARVVFVNHGSSFYRELPAEPHMLFVDIIPPPHRAQEFVDAGAFVLDHHKTARAIVEMFGARGIFADEAKEPGVSGAVLAYREVWRPLRGPQSDDLVECFAELAGIRDTWQTQSPLWRSACAQAEVLKFYPAEEWLGHARIFDRHRFDERMQLGLILYERKLTRAQSALAESRSFHSNKGTRFTVVSTLETSDIGDLFDGDVLVGFGFRNDLKLGLQMIWSTRSRGDFDCGRFCAWLGGGGHSAAAGAEMPISFADAQPYSLILTLLNRYETETRPAHTTTEASTNDNDVLAIIQDWMVDAGLQDDREHVWALDLAERLQFRTDGPARFEVSASALVSLQPSISFGERVECALAADHAARNEADPAVESESEKISTHDEAGG